MKPKNKQYIEHTRLNETLFSKTGIKLKFYSIDNGGDYPIHGAALFFVGSGNEKWVVTQWNDVGKNVENSFLDIDVKSLEEMICRTIEAIGPRVKITLDWHGCVSVCRPSPELRLEEAIIEGKINPVEGGE